MNLTQIDRSILAHAEFNPDLTLRELSRLTRAKEQTVAYRLNRLRDHGVIRRGALINHVALGFTNMAVYFSLRSYTESTFNRLRAEIEKCPRVVWFGSLAGDFQFGMAYLVHHPEEVVNFLGHLSQTLHLTFSRKEITPRTAHHCFARTFTAVRGNRSFVSMLRPANPYECDTIDQLILTHLSNSPWTSLRHLATLCGASPSTVERRVQKLAENGIIRLVYGIDPEQLGVTSYRLLIRTERFETGLHEAVLTFCKAQPGTVMLFESVGPWDFEIDFEAPNPHDVRRFQQELDSATGGAISEMRVLAELEDYKFSFFPRGLASSSSVKPDRFTKT